MKSSLIESLQQICAAIIPNDAIHAKWINTLSYLENCGARKIARCEHPIKVKEEMLKHAWEEFRHAYYLKRQIERVIPNTLIDYSPPNILGGFASIHYLSCLDLATCRYLSQRKGLSGALLKHQAYLLVTYVIEVRASELYKIYQENLTQFNSKVTVKSILLEEADHLLEMQKELSLIQGGADDAIEIGLIEKNLYDQWINTIRKEIKKL